MIKNYTFEITREVTCDTVVVGGGLAGSAAAIAAARGGNNTVLVEAGGTLGGQAGIGIVTPLSSECAYSGERFGGILDELFDDIRKYTKKYVSCGMEGKPYYPISPHITKLLLLKKADESGVHIRFHTTLFAVETDSNRIVSLILHDKSGLVRVYADSFIDATGDADLVYLAKDSFVLGSERGVYRTLEDNSADFVHDSKLEFSTESEHLMQPVSLFFIMGNVDYPKASALNNKRLVFGDLGITVRRFKEWQYSGTEGFEITSDQIPTPQGRVLMTPGRRENEAVINMSRILNINGADADSLSEGEVKAQKQLIAIIDFLKTFIPGFENSYLVETSSRLGVRESRRLVGKYVLSGRELIDCVSFPDTVCRGRYIVDIHDPVGKGKAIGGRIKGDYFEIPFGSICSAKYENLLAGGRCVSCDHIAASAVRIQGACILTGQAAGTACALGKQLGAAPCNLDAQQLREKLKADKVRL